MPGKRSTTGEGTQLFFGGCVPRGFQNVGSKERIYLEKRGSWERKFGSRELEFWPKHDWKCKNFQKFENGSHKSGALKLNWCVRERRMAWKKGVMTVGHPHTPFQCECPPGVVHSRLGWNAGAVSLHKVLICFVWNLFFFNNRMDTPPFTRYNWPISTDAARYCERPILCQNCRGSLHIEQKNPSIQIVTKHMYNLEKLSPPTKLHGFFSQKSLVNPEWKYFNSIQFKIYFHQKNTQIKHWITATKMEEVQLKARMPESWCTTKKREIHQKE